MPFKIGDSVKVKEGIMCPDNDYNKPKLEAV